MSRSSAPYGMLLDRGLTLEQLDVAYEIGVANPDPRTNRRELTIALRDVVSEQEAEGKTKKCLTRIWLNPPPEAEEMIGWARQLNFSGDRRLLHFGALLATFPFVGSVARVLGQHLQTEGSVDASDLRTEVRRRLGDRPSVDVAARKAYTTLRQLGLVEQSEQTLRPAPEIIGAPELSTWLAHAVLLTRQAESISASTALSAPELLGVVRGARIERSYPLLESHTEADGTVLVHTRSAPTIDVVEVAPDDARIADVFSLWRAQRKWLGFLPNQGFTDRAAKGTLLIAVAGQTVAGYVLYDLPGGDRVKVVHVCVSELYRGHGVARRLVDAVSERHPGRRGIELNCRRDFPASDVWPQLGFIARQEAPGRSDAGLPLTHWYRDHGHPDLFTYDPSSDLEARLAAALDQNIVIDLLTEREEGAESRHLEDPWISEYITLCITDEVDQEIDRCEDASERERMRRSLTRFRRLSTPYAADRTTWDDLVAVIEDAAPKADSADHRHVARSVVGGATYFVTRDGALNDAAPRILETVGLQVMRPEILIAYIDRLRSQERYEPAALHATSFEVTSAAGHESAFISDFLNYGEGERKADLQTVFRQALANPKTHSAEVVRSEDGRLVGAIVTSAHAGGIEVHAIRVAGADRTSYAVARQLAFLQRERAAATRAPKVFVTDAHPTQAVRYALVLEGFRQDGDRWVCEVATGVRPVGAINLTAFPAELPVEAKAGTVERDRWPLKVTGAGIPTFLVPIRPQWAEQLFDSELAAGTLFGREAGLGLSREHVYYRKPRNANGITPPARLLWYVSGRSNGQPEGAIRAVSQLAEVVVDRPLTVYQRFERLGVYTREQVIDAADDRGLVMAMRFVGTELFATPLGISSVRAIFEDDGSKFVAPMSPRRLDERRFVALYNAASAYAS